MSQEETWTDRNNLLMTKIGIGWVTSLLVQTIVLLMVVVNSLLTEVDTKFRSLRIDPGSQVLRLLVYLVALYALPPLYIFAVGRFRSKAFRWVGVALAILGFVFNFLHHMAHWYSGQRPDFTAHVMDLILHIIGIWVVINTIRWAKMPAPEGAVTKS
jgi:4-amino-4-deoxy-L-arabinose transferase-like glycosyltransferase